MRELELRGQGAEPTEVGLARDLVVGVVVALGVVPERVRDAVHDIRDGSRGRALQLLQHGLRSRAAQERAVAHLIRDARGRERLLERLGAGVDPVQDRDLFQRDVVGAQLVHGLDDRRDLLLHVVDGTRDHRRSRLHRRLERLAEPAQVRGQLVREAEDLRRRAVVALQADDRRVREPIREPEQVVGRGAGERVDRLVIVAHDAEVVAIAQPAVEQRRLQRVHVLELVDRERLEPFADRLGGLRVRVEHLDREPEHVLEVDLAVRLLAPFVPLVHAEHQLGRDRRLVIRPLELGQVAVGLDHAVLRPFDLTGQLAPGQELVRGGQGVRERGDERRLVIEHGRDGRPRTAFPELVQVGKRRRVERTGVHALDAEPREPALELARGLLGERDRQDLLRRERPGGDLIGDPMRDGGRLAGAGAGQDGDRATVRAGRLTLLLVQVLEDLLSVHPSNLPATADTSSCPPPYR